jgi:lysophospholipase L1-like esterase
VRPPALLASGLLLALAAPPATADDNLSVRADVRDTGYIRLHLHAQPGLPLTIRDEATGRVATLTPASADVTQPRFAEWSCEPRIRHFTVTQEDLTASTEVRTPSCARRLAMVGPRAVRAGGRAAMLVRDRWGLGGISARFCVHAPGARRRCRALDVRTGRRFRRGNRAGFAALRPGTYRLSLHYSHAAVRRRMRAKPPGGRLRILATGDSMIQIIDSYLKARAGGRTRVRSDAHVSTGLSKPSLLDWQAQARRQAARRPDVVVMFIGANDGFPMAGRDCCAAPWMAEYARRARRMMRVYARGGRARVLWLLLPAPRGGFFREVFPAVNAALRRAARGLEDDVRLIDLPEIFTPGGRYRESIQVDGKSIRVRQSDGVHLNTAGASIAANTLLRTLRAERILR